VRGKQGGKKGGTGQGGSCADTLKNRYGEGVGVIELVMGEGKRGVVVMRKRTERWERTGREETIV